MKFLFLCKTQLQVVNYILIFEKFYGQIDEAVFCFLDNKRSGLYNLQKRLPGISNKIRVVDVNFPSNLRIDAWLKNKNNERNNLSFFDSFLYTFGLNRNLIRNRVFGSSIDILGAKFDRVYLFNYSNYIGWILENLLSNSSKISIIDEGVCSYIVNLYDRDLLRKADEVLLYDPSLVVGEFPENIKVLQLDATGFSKPQVIDWLKRLFPKVKGVSSRKDEIIWIGQNFGSSEKGARRLKFRKAHVELFRDFVKKYASENEVIRYRPHPSKLKELDKIAENCDFCEIDISSGNPYEVELLLNYKELPREIHTISSSGALYLYMLLTRVNTRKS